MKAGAILNKEIKVGLASPILYVVFAVFLLIAGFMFFAMTKSAALRPFSFSGPGSISLMEAIFRPLSRDYALILMFLTPWVTMRLFAEEKRTGTLELLFTYPVRDLDLIIGKFIGAVVLLALILAPTVIYCYLIQKYTALEWGVIGTQYLGLFLLGTAYLAVGLWASSLTDNQIVAAAITFGTLLAFTLMDWLTQNAHASMWIDTAKQLSILNHLDNFGKGLVNTTDLTYYLLFIGFFFYFTLKIIEAHRWWGTKE